MSFSRSLLGWIAIVNVLTVTKPDINNMPQNSWSTRNKKGRGKPPLSFFYFLFSCILFYFQGTEREVQSQISLSPLTKHCDGSSWPSKGERNGFLISATGTCQTNLSYLPVTSTFKFRLQLHHPGILLHQSPKLVDLLWGWRTDNVCVTHAYPDCASPAALLVMTFPRDSHQAGICLKALILLEDKNVQLFR